MKATIRFKITLWFALAMILICGGIVSIVLMVSDNVIQKNLRDTLIEMVSANLDEVAFYKQKELGNPDGDRDLYIRYQDGYLEIDDDYLDRMNGIYTSLYDDTHQLLYGEDPTILAQPAFHNDKLQKITYRNTTYYVYDRSLKDEGMPHLWLRGVVSTKQGKRWMDPIVLYTLWLLPALVLITLLGGYFLAGRFLRPIQDMMKTARSIEEGQDLKKRMMIGKGNDELHQLAETFNAMMNRLETSFHKEQQFTSDVSHELRTPLSVILSQCEMALEECTQEVEREDWQRVQRQGLRMAETINDLLVMSRMDQQPVLAKELLDFSLLCRSVCEDMQGTLKKVTLSWDIEEDITILGKDVLLRRLLQNLIENSDRYGREHGFSKVRLEKTPTEIILSVTDNGKGIEPKACAHIWERFYQVDASRNGEGSGLGLAMAVQIAQLHGGHMEVSSELHKGSCFSFHLPVSKT